MAFIFSDLVVFPVLRIQTRYYGWKMALYILAIFLCVLITAALILHYGFAAAGMLPDPGSGTAASERKFFQIDYTFFLNMVFIAVSAGFFAWRAKMAPIKFMAGDTLTEKFLFFGASGAILWLAGGLFFHFYASL